MNAAEWAELLDGDDEKGLHGMETPGGLAGYQTIDREVAGRLVYRDAQARPRVLRWPTADEMHPAGIEVTRGQRG